MDGHPGSRKTLWPWVESGGVEVDGSLPKVTGVRAGQREACPGALFQCCFPHKESEQPSLGSPVGPELQGPGAPHQASACFQNEEQAVFRKGLASLLDPSGRSLPGSRCGASLRGAETPPWPQATFLGPLLPSDLKLPVCLTITPGTHQPLNPHSPPSSSSFHLFFKLWQKPRNIKFTSLTNF